MCSRCGADLKPLMVLAATSWRLRQSAREALARGESSHARDFALRAQELHRTPAGDALLRLTTLLDSAR
jgi:hypothetical protein